MRRKKQRFADVAEWIYNNSLNIFRNCFNSSSLKAKQDITVINCSTPALDVQLSLYILLICCNYASRSVNFIRNVFNN